jgi:beta-galactosidase
VLHIATRDWRMRAGSRPDDAARPITVYSNLEEVELFLDGTSLGRQPTVNATARWNVTLHDGDNRLRARGVRAGTAIEDVTVVEYTDRSSFFTDVRSRAGLIAVNAGGSAQVIGDGDVVWEADRPYTPGSWGYTEGTPTETHHRMINSEEDPLLQTARANAGSYRFDVPDGRYEIRLRFVDFENGAAGARVLDVSVNDVSVVQALDLAASPGRWMALERAVEVQAAGGKGITVTLSPQKGASTISALLVRRL